MFDSILLVVLSSQLHLLLLCSAQCWFHLINDVLSKNPFGLNPDPKSQVREGLDLLHNSPNKSFFDAAWAVVKAKWLTIDALRKPNSKHPNTTFVQYFEQYWINQTTSQACNWFLGCYENRSSNSVNDAVESYNRWGIHVGSHLPRPAELTDSESKFLTDLK
jgi:hypothetical protein